MIQFLFGDNKSKINNYISEFSKKNKLHKVNFDLKETPYSEIILNLQTPDLFGEKNLFIIDITEAENENNEKFIDYLNNDLEAVITYYGNIDQRTKTYKLLTKFKVLNFPETNDSNIFNFVDFILEKDVFKSYNEYEKLIKNGDSDLGIFSLIISAYRNLILLKLEAGHKIPPFKIKKYKELAEKYSLDDLKRIYFQLYLNDLRFKKGELESDMLIIHTMNFIFN